MRAIMALMAGAALLMGADGALAKAASSHKAATTSAGSAAMKSCAAQWQEMKKAGTAKGSYKDFSKTCMAGKGAAPTTGAAATAPAPAAKPAATPAAKPAATPQAKTTTPGSADAAGATAKCKDGTYSHAKTHSGACSKHGGVAEWLKP
jgi:Protein of unknown function (DUF3761)